MDFIAEGGLLVCFLDDNILSRAFELVVQCADTPMDLADASLVATAENEDIRRLFPILDA